MLICYWDIRNLRENIDLVADLLRREEPDVLILQNIANFDHTWTDAFTDYDDQRLFNSNTELTNRSTASHVYTERFTHGALTLAKNDVLAQEQFSSLDTSYRLLLLNTTDNFRINVFSTPSFGYTPQRHALRKYYEDNFLWNAPSTLDYQELFIGNFAITPSDLDLHPALKTPRQPLNHPATRARFNAWMASGWFDVYREHNPSAGYYTAWRRAADSHFRTQNIGARTTMALASARLRERVTRSWHLDRYTRSHSCPIMLYVRPYGDPPASPKPIAIEWGPGISPTDRVYPGTDISISLGINLALPPYDPNAPTYQWYKDGVELADSAHIFHAFTHGYESSLMQVLNVQYEDAGEYTCRIQNSTNSVLSDPVTLWVEDPIEPWIDPWGGYNTEPPLAADSNPYTEPA